MISDSAYRIHKNVRDMLVFSEQNVIKVPPFSKLDLISCRNLLIYLGAELTTALHKTSGTKETVIRPGLRVRTNGDFTTVNLAVRSVAAVPAASPEPPSVPQASMETDAPSVDADARIAALKQEGSQSVTDCHQLKLEAADGKKYATDVANPETLLRLIQSVPNPKAEPVKLWLARVGYARIQDMSDPARSLDRAREYWQQHGRSE